MISGLVSTLAAEAVFKSAQANWFTVIVHFGRSLLVDGWDSVQQGVRSICRQLDISIAMHSREHQVWTFVSYVFQKVLTSCLYCLILKIPIDMFFSTLLGKKCPNIMMTSKVKMK